jgi:NAD(P)-dependent dehydrogenase (short-subunit alcohol dehydrogenase family)
MFDYRSMFDLTGKTALVIGAGSGIGEAGAHGLSACGATVFCADVNGAAAERTAEEARSQGWQAESVELDMTDSGSVRAAAERVETPDVLVSTPSINVRKQLLEYTDEEFDRVVNLNLKGTFRLIREFAGDMVERGSGSIIAFSSIRAQLVEPGQGVYAATKSGTVQMLRALAAELGPPGRQGQHRSPRGGRDAAYCPDQREPRLVRLIRSQEHPRPLGQAPRDGGYDRLPRLGYQLLRHRRVHALRRQLDRRRRTLHPAFVDGLTDRI